MNIDYNSHDIDNYDHGSYYFFDFHQNGCFAPQFYIQSVTVVEPLDAIKDSTYNMCLEIYPPSTDYKYRYMFKVWVMVSEKRSEYGVVKEFFFKMP